MNAYTRNIGRIKNIEKKLLMDRLRPSDPEHELDVETREKLIDEMERLQAALEDLEIERF